MKILIKGNKATVYRKDGTIMNIKTRNRREMIDFLMTPIGHTSLSDYLRHLRLCEADTQEINLEAYDAQLDFNFKLGGDL